MKCNVSSSAPEGARNRAWGNDSIGIFPTCRDISVILTPEPVQLEARPGTYVPRGCRSSPIQGCFAGTSGGGFGSSGRKPERAR